MQVGLALRNARVKTEVSKKTFRLHSGAVALNWGPEEMVAAFNKKYKDVHCLTAFYMGVEAYSDPPYAAPGAAIEFPVAIRRPLRLRP